MLRMIGKEELEKILEDHKHWIEQNVANWENMKANLSETDLFGADLRCADLSGANLYNAGLLKAELYRARLRGATLSKADLYEADLCMTDLREADLSGASLVGANLYKANLRKADLSGANLSGANLFCADLSGANLSGAKLTGTNIYEAAFYGINVSDSACPMACPDIGSFIGWKKALVTAERLSSHKDIISFPVIVKLQIPECAKRSSATGRKCRCNEAKVLDIQSLEGKSLPKETIAHSRFDLMFTYEIDKTVKVDNFDENRWEECSAGIHFFITRQEAVDYELF